MLKTIPPFILCLVILCCLAPSARAQRVYTLEECFPYALKRSQTLVIQKETIVQEEEKYRQALSNALPYLESSASYLRQQTLIGNTAFRRNAAAEAKLSATQTLFGGLREFSAMREFHALKDADRFDLQNATLKLYQDLARNFYAILSAQQELEDLKTEFGFYDKRITELRDRLRIGRSRSSEVLSVQSAKANLQATQASLLGQLEAEREVFVFLTGMDRLTPLRDSRDLPDDPEPLENFLALKDKRPDLLALRERIRGAKFNVAVQRGAHAPTVGVQGNYYLIRTDTFQDLQRDPIWDVKGTVTLPIFSGGATQSKVRESQSQLRQADAAHQQGVLTADQEIRSFHQKIRSDLVEVTAYRDAYELATKNYDVQSRDYRLGLVTNLDVLQALTTLQESKRAYDRTVFNSKLDALLLETAVAREPAIH